MKLAKKLLALSLVCSGVLILALILWPESESSLGPDPLDDFEGLEISSSLPTTSTDYPVENFAKQTNQPNANTILKTGDRFPFHKKIVQRVSQYHPEGTLSSISNIDITMRLRVVKTFTDGKILWSVDFPKVQYRRKAPGGYVEYDSTIAADKFSPEAALYAGLTFSGFSFYEHRNEQRFEIEHRDVFLKRILRRLPKTRQSELMQYYKSLKPNEFIALFVDESWNRANTLRRKSPGEVWEHTLEVNGSVPFRQRNVITVGSKQDDKTSAEIRGMVMPSERQLEKPKRLLDCSIVEGHAQGSLLVDNPTGLPERTRMQREITMKLSLPNGVQFFQTQSSHKEFDLIPREKKPVAQKRPAKTMPAVIPTAYTQDSRSR